MRRGMTEYIIDAEGIVVKFGDFTAVNGIDVKVEAGKIYGFLGPNGAGKTTTVKVLTTMMRPTEGTVTIGGHPASKEPRQARDLIGVVQQHIALDKDISVRENIICRAVLHKIPRKDIDRRMTELADAIGLTPYLDKIVGNLSGGWKRKVAILCALMHSPKILFLDEPTAGLDTQSRHMLWDMIRQMNQMGTTVFLTTHYMDEAETLCDKVSIINRGSITDSGSPRDLCRRLGAFVVEYDTDDGKKQYRFFQDREGAKEYFGSLSEKNAVMRATHLEDVFLEETGRDNMKVTEKRLRV